MKTKSVKEPSTSVSTKEMESEGLGAVVALLNDNSLIDVFEYRITPKSLATFNPNGTFRKCQKPKLIQYMNTKKAEDISNDYIAIVDMGIFIIKQFQIQINESKRTVSYTLGKIILNTVERSYSRDTTELQPSYV